MDGPPVTDPEIHLTTTQLRALADVHRLLLQVAAATAGAPNQASGDEAVPADGQPGLLDMVKMVKITR